MERALKYVLKTYFDEYVRGLDTNVDCSRLPATLHDLPLKHEKLNELIDENSTACPFEFTDGVIGSIKLMPSWRGNLQVVASDVVLNLAFCPIKAMRKAMKPTEDDEEDEHNQVPVDVQHGLCSIGGIKAPQVLSQAQVNQLVDVANGKFQQPAPAQAQVAPRYCAIHNESEKRKKAQARSCQCSMCKMPVQTTYVDFALCPLCSKREKKCMCCGAGVDSPAAVFPPSLNTPSIGHHRGVDGPPRGGSYVPPPNAGSMLDASRQNGSVGAGMQQALPRYCASHAVSEKRIKGDPRTCECQGCGAPMQTNYAAFSFCPACSEKESKCMYCGADVDSSHSHIPGAAADVSAGLPTPTRQPAHYQAMNVARLDALDAEDSDELDVARLAEAWQDHSGQKIGTSNHGTRPRNADVGLEQMRDNSPMRQRSPSSAANCSAQAKLATGHQPTASSCHC